MLVIKTSLLPKDVVAIALYPLVLVSKEKHINEYVINHERIHLRQQLELLIIPFYLWYGIEYLALWIKYKDGDKAYRSISFEKEAYANEGNLDYLHKRRSLSFLKYV